jgi:NADPH-dependent 2,4-dienoyl-CoA reductase/sulfur reductase-like enzyme
MKMPSYDLVIIGAGPAGMAAASSASEYGLKVAILDEQASLGGQIYRSLSRSTLVDESILGPDYYQGRALIKQAQKAKFDYLPNSTVWSISSDLIINLTCQQQGRQIKTKKLIIATGAQERPTPFPGWTLPCVMTCGSAQILLKSSGLTPPGPLVLAGSGPLLLLIAAQLKRAGVEIKAILDTTPKGRYIAALPFLPKALKNLPLLLKGLSLIAEIKRSNIPVYKQVSHLSATSASQEGVDKVTFKQGEKEISLSCRTLLTHQGVVPNVQLTRALQLDHHWHDLQECWHPSLDKWGQSSHPDIFIAGDSAGIAGAKSAAYLGELSALKIAKTLNKVPSDTFEKRTSNTMKKLIKESAIRPFLDTLYRPAKSFLIPSDDTIVCRCEEVNAKEIRDTVANGCQGPNQSKAFSRAGMGPCQGRLCGLTVANVIADERNIAVDDVGYYQVRSPIKPITLSELIDLAE